MWYVGLDFHWMTSTVCILDENGKKVKGRTIRGHWDRTVAWLGQLEEPFVICFEASCGYGALYDALAKIARRVTVAHPGRVRLIFRSKRKNDRIDAEKLAKLLYLNEVPCAYVPSLWVRSWRQLIEFRRKLVDKRTRSKNGLRSLLRSHGIVAPRGLWTRKGRAWLASVEMPTVLAACQRDLLLEELEQFHQQVQRVTKELDAMGCRSSGVTLLRTIGGVGPRTAEAVVAYLDDPARFGSSRQVGAYFGMVPCEDASAGVSRLGHITKEGPGTARKLLIEATWQVIRHCPAMRSRFDRIAGGRSDRRKTALVATAHYLLRCMYSMLRTGEAWRHAG
jgi:transposase